MADQPIQMMTDHYQKTFEITYEQWKERNRLFIFLVIVSGIGLLLLLPVPEMNKLLVDAIAKLLGITDQGRITQLYTDFPLDVLLSLFLVVIFYLMQKLYSTNLSVLRNYLYLGAVEREIRQHLKLAGQSVAFTREGNFYWGRRTWMQNFSKWYYIVIILIVLLPFLYFKLLNDFAAKNVIMGILDGVVSILTLLYLWEYSFSAVRLDVAELPQPETKPDQGKKKGK